MQCFFIFSSIVVTSLRPRSEWINYNSIINGVFYFFYKNQPRDLRGCNSCRHRQFSGICNLRPCRSPKALPATCPPRWPVDRICDSFFRWALALPLETFPADSSEYCLLWVGSKEIGGRSLYSPRGKKNNIYLRFNSMHLYNTVHSIIMNGVLNLLNISLIYILLKIENFTHLENFQRNYGVPIYILFSIPRSLYWFVNGISFDKWNVINQIRYL